MVGRRLCEAFEGAHRWFGRSIVAAVIVVIAVFGNEGLASYRAIRWHPPRTIKLFKQPNRLRRGSAGGVWGVGVELVGGVVGVHARHGGLGEALAGD